MRIDPLITNTQCILCYQIKNKWILCSIKGTTPTLFENPAVVK